MSATPGTERAPTGDKAVDEVLSQLAAGTLPIMHLPEGDFERFIANFDYQLPVIHGWSLTGIVLVQSGMPMTLTDPNGGTVYGRAATSTVTMCPGASYAGLVTAGLDLGRSVIRK